MRFCEQSSGWWRPHGTVGRGPAPIPPYLGAVDIVPGFVSCPGLWSLMSGRRTFVLGTPELWPGQTAWKAFKYLQCQIVTYWHFNLGKSLQFSQPQISSCKNEGLLFKVFSNFCFIQYFFSLVNVTTRCLFSNNLINFYCLGGLDFLCLCRLFN